MTLLPKRIWLTGILSDEPNPLGPNDATGATEANAVTPEIGISEPIAAEAVHAETIQIETASETKVAASDSLPATAEIETSPGTDIHSYIDDFIIGAPVPSKPVAKGKTAEAANSSAKDSAVEETKMALSLGNAEDHEANPLPRSLELLFIDAPRRKPTYGMPTCSLQLRSYSVRNLEFFCDFALRAAYFLGLPAAGPVPLPRKRELWTVPKSNFVHKKSQENFSRITLRRLIQIKDGHPEVVQIWLAFLQKHAYYGIGMKANVWEFSSLGKCSCLLGSYLLTRRKIDVAKDMDKLARSVEKSLHKKFKEHLIHTPALKGVGNVEQFLADERLRASGGR